MFLGKYYMYNASACMHPIHQDALTIRSRGFSRADSACPVRRLWMDKLPPSFAPSAL